MTHTDREWEGLTNEGLSLALRTELHGLELALKRSDVNRMSVCMDRIITMRSEFRLRSLAKIRERNRNGKPE